MAKKIAQAKKGFLAFCSKRVRSGARSLAVAGEHRLFEALNRNKKFSTRTELVGLRQSDGEGGAFIFFTFNSESSAERSDD